jgi:hypothetical protein
MRKLTRFPVALSRTMSNQHHRKALTILQNVCTNPQTNGKCISNEPDSRTFATWARESTREEREGGKGRVEKRWRGILANEVGIYVGVGN